MSIILIIIIIIFSIITVNGFNYLIPFILAIINFILSSLNLITDRNNFISRLIQLVSLSFIIFVIITNLIELGDDLVKLSFIPIISWKDFKFRSWSFVHNQRTEVLWSSDLKNIKNIFLDKLDSDQTYLINLKFDFLLKNITSFKSYGTDTILITNQVDPQEFIDYIENDMTKIKDMRIDGINLTDHWRETVTIEIIYYKLEVNV